VMAIALCAATVRAEDVKMEGTLIDQMCGEKMMKKDDPQKAADEHSKACALKEGCAKAGFAIIADGKMTKLTPESTDKAKEYLEKNDSTKVVVEGTKKDDGSIEAKSITAAPAK